MSHVLHASCMQCTVLIACIILDTYLYACACAASQPIDRRSTWPIPQVGLASTPGASSWNLVCRSLRSGSSNFALHIRSATLGSLYFAAICALVNHTRAPCTRVDFEVRIFWSNVLFFHLPAQLSHSSSKSWSFSEPHTTGMKCLLSFRDTCKAVIKLWWIMVEKSQKTYIEN